MRIAAGIRLFGCGAIANSIAEGTGCPLASLTTPRTSPVGAHSIPPTVAAPPAGTSTATLPIRTGPEPTVSRYLPGGNPATSSRPAASVAVITAVLPFAASSTRVAATGTLPGPSSVAVSLPARVASRRSGNDALAGTVNHVTPSLANSACGLPSHHSRDDSPNWHSTFSFAGTSIANVPS